MKWLKLAGFLGGAGAVLAGCGLLFPADRLRQKITVEVETPAGLRSGSSVVETEVHKGKSWGDASGTTLKLRGEAVALDLPGGRTLFALLRGANDTQGDAAGFQTRLWASSTSTLLPDAAKRDWGVEGDAVAVDLPGGKTLFALMKTSNPMREDLAQMSMAALDPAFENDIVESAGRLSQRSGVRIASDVARGDFPLLVTFRNAADPKSVAKVDPNQLSLHFGAGARLKRVWVELTDDEVTKEIENRLMWLGDGGLSLDPDAQPTTDPTFAQSLRHSAFWHGPR